MGCEVCNRDPEVQRLIALSPRLAYAVASGLPLIQYPFTITAGFSAAGNPDPVLAQTPSDDPLNRDFLIEEIDVDVQTPKFNTGSLWKPEADLAYDYTSGIQASLTRRGLYGQAYDQMPLKAFPKMVSQGRPMPLLAEQTLLMSFFVTTPLPSCATNITITFLSRTTPKDWPFSTDLNKIFDCLDTAGYDTRPSRRMFSSAT